jgi:hypothetical protein
MESSLSFLYLRSAPTSVTIATANNYCQSQNPHKHGLAPPAFAHALAVAAIGAARVEILQRAALFSRARNRNLNPSASACGSYLPLGFRMLPFSYDICATGAIYCGINVHSQHAHSNQPVLPKSYTSNGKTDDA